MYIPKYWARSVQSIRRADGRLVSFSSWMWSDISVEDARQKAGKRASVLQQRLQNGEQLNRYSYGDRYLREEILQALRNSKGQETGIVTRNAYGALVLNSARAMFIDIDFARQDQSGSLAGQLKGLFGQPAPKPEDPYIQKIIQWGASRPDLGLRIYRTFAGLRCLVTNVEFDPAQAESANLLKSLSSDPLYIRLCQAQECFRARLTPKPWRCGLRQPAQRYPFENSQAELRFRQWEQAYTSIASRYAACRLVRQIGPAQVHPDIEPILRYHDQVACPGDSFNLA